jgi:hypothetical protein
MDLIKKKREDINKLFPGITILDHNEIITNPFSGESIELTPEEVAVYDYLKGCEMLGLYEEMRKALSWFIDNSPQAYMTLLD